MIMKCLLQPRTPTVGSRWGRAFYHQNAILAKSNNTNLGYARLLNNHEAFKELTPEGKGWRATPMQEYTQEANLEPSFQRWTRSPETKEEGKGKDKGKKKKKGAGKQERTEEEEADVPYITQEEKEEEYIPGIVELKKIGKDNKKFLSSRLTNKTIHTHMALHLLNLEDDGKEKAGKTSEAAKLKKILKKNDGEEGKEGHPDLRVGDGEEGKEGHPDLRVGDV